MAGPPATGVAETVKLSGTVPQLVHPTVRVADVSSTAIAEIVAVGLAEVTEAEVVSLESPLYVTDASMT